MHKQRTAALKIAAAATDALVVAGTYAAVLQLRVWLGESGWLELPPMEVRPQLPLLWLILPAWLVCLMLMGTYRDLRRVRSQALLARVIRAVVAGFVSTVVILYALHAAAEVSRTLLFGLALASIPSLYVTRRAMVHAARSWFANMAVESVLVVGDPEDIRPILDTLRARPEWGLRVTSVVRDLDGIGRALQNQEVHRVLVAGGPWDLDRLRIVADNCEEMGVRFSMDANFLGLSTSRAILDDLDGWNLLTFSSGPTDAEALVVKRLMDVVLSMILLVFFVPLLAVVAVMIRREDGGPILFTQLRSGLYGRPFTLYKFRSMEVDADARQAGLASFNEMTGPVFKMRHDPRVTRVGSWLRRTSIDELPQLCNVLKGDMSLVGPRPPRPDEVARYDRWQLRRLSMKPGLTCTWQVSGRNEVDFDRWMALDLQYIDNWTLLLDLKLLLRTVPAVVRGLGAH